MAQVGKDLVCVLSTCHGLLEVCIDIDIDQGSSSGSAWFGSLIAKCLDKGEERGGKKRKEVRNMGSTPDNMGWWVGA